MYDSKYCYPNTNVLINKLNIRDSKELFEIEKKLTFIRLQELQYKPIKGKYDFKYLKAIHKYIFQDIYEWAGQERTVEIGKGNLFCPMVNIREYADVVFAKYFPQCYEARNNKDKFIEMLAKNYGDLNALHPFREGNGRTQREFARLVCNKCGYDFVLSYTTHKQMLQASKLSFDYADNSLFINIFKKAVTLYDANLDVGKLKILSSDDLRITMEDSDYGYNESKDTGIYTKIYKEKIKSMKSNIK